MQKVFAPPLEESRWVLITLWPARCHQVVLGRVGQDHRLCEGLSLLCELTAAFSFLRVCLHSGHVVQLPELPLFLCGLSGCCFCTLYQVSQGYLQEQPFCFFLSSEVPHPAVCLLGCQLASDQSSEMSPRLFSGLLRQL